MPRSRRVCRCPRPPCRRAWSAGNPGRGYRVPHQSGRLCAVTTRNGEVACDKAVIAAGAWSKVLAQAAGDRVFLETERGYHIVISDPGMQPRYPVMPSDGKMACVMTPEACGWQDRWNSQDWTQHLTGDAPMCCCKFARKVFPASPLTLPPEGSSSGWATGLQPPTDCRYSAQPRAVPISCTPSDMGMSDLLPPQ